MPSTDTAEKFWPHNKKVLSIFCKRNAHMDFLCQSHQHYHGHLPHLPTSPVPSRSLL